MDSSALEYYDFFIYAQAAALIFPQIFFPNTDPKMAIIASLATYGVGYLARPVGAFVLGHWGDTRGRKNVLLLCMFLMGLSTMAVGLLPTYHDIGYLAPALLVVLRLIQGFAVAGEISGASSMIMSMRRSVEEATTPVSPCKAYRPARCWRRQCSCHWLTSCLAKPLPNGAGAFRS